MATSDPFQWLRNHFGRYYETARPSIPKLERREFGFGGWDKKIEFRHLHFKALQDLWTVLAKDKPLYVSCSSAYYDFPDGRPMAKKGWRGADLVFDLDAEAHSCAPFTCHECFEGIKRKTTTLIEDFLVPDFGFKPEEMQISFSGSRGYHVRIYRPEVEGMGREDRREVVDYIEGAGLDADGLLVEEPIPGHPNMHRLMGPTPTMGGYKGKFARRVAHMLKDAGTAALISPKLKKAEASARFLKGIEAGRWSDVPIPNAKTRFKEIFDQLKINLSDQVGTDANVTIDTAKILRLPDSIHGGSGMVAKTVPYAQVAGFEPMKDALAFPMGGQMRILATRDIPSLEIGGQTLEAIQKDAWANVPPAYAIYLVCKKAALPA